MTRPIVFLLALLVAAPLCGVWTAASAQDQGADFDAPLEAKRLQAFQERRAALIAHYADQVPPDDLTRGGYVQIAANLYRGTNIDWVVARLDSLMQAPRGDMFWMFPFTTTMYLGREHLPEATKRAMRDLWRTYAPYRGDTENHWAMYYASLYLVTQLYPDEPGTTWFTGKSSRENFDEAEEYLLSWMDLATTIGQGEYDSAHYHNVYLAPMAMLYAFAEDPAMRQRAAMMLDYLLADFAAENLAGYYVGSHSRVYEREAMAPWRVPTAGAAWLLFGQGPMAVRGDLFPLAASGYVPPRIVHLIATDRSTPYVHREAKRTRHRMRYSEVKNVPVYKYTYVRPEYALGSSQGGLLQPIQQQTWDLTWVPEGDRLEARNTFYGVHPYSSYEELGMYFAELNEFITELIVRSKTEYDSPDKLTGGSPYEQVFQHEDALIALYDIEPGTRYEHINTFFSDDLQDVTEDASGWIFARGGPVLIAYYPLQPYTWEPVQDYFDEERRHRRLMSPHRHNGYIVQTAPASAYASMAAFQDAVRALPLETMTEPVPAVRFTALDGTSLTARYGDAPTVDGRAVDYAAEWELFDGPFLHAERGSRRLEMRYGPMRRLLDFTNLTVDEWVEPSATSSADQL